MFKSIKRPNIEFLCHKEDFGVIPEPYPARKLMPEWYKEVPPRIEGKVSLRNSTIKRCAPFLDAMSIGWIIPLAADVDFQVNADASGLTFSSAFYRPMVESHSRPQIEASVKHPESPKPPMKWLNWWIIKVPKDYSILFVPPLNRPDSRFQCISGLVDVDGYFEFINFPFFFTQPNYTGIVQQGTPLVQAIPIHRSMLGRESSSRGMNPTDLASLEDTRRKRQSHESHYRDQVWSRK